MAMAEDIFTAFHAALESPQPLLGMREVVERELADDVPRAEVMLQLEQLRIRLQEHGAEAEEDVVLEVMDFLTGWSSPHMRL